ncbi:homocitrate synthase [Mycobacterium sp. shizuoka-1]|uniref:homocitrate synthase n=1 Tax=Mycobacterium sp. shizuoka-1 TaxID=2039281 RepID=UPI000C05DBC8|nr:homocitrate synthase [Mycobacterium sp. shizuoka-1]GAY15052.1 hypothetical protein MSZK_17780 [Mycobacterium sp. shizuoka-1]
MTPHSTPISDLSPRFGAPLPVGLREHAEAMPWSTFTATYSPSGGPVRLGAWESDEVSRLSPHPRRFRATLAVGDRIETAIAHAGGPVAALTAMLYERGIGVEMTRFHQLASGAHTATFVQGSDGRRREWAMGWSDDPTQSALRAVIACANRLLSIAQTDDWAGKAE